MIKEVIDGEAKLSSVQREQDPEPDPIAIFSWGKPILVGSGFFS
jgi:hypothetical protein